ncbi:MAG: alkaline phosphatase family protein [Candidatus Cybelea sp.]
MSGLMKPAALLRAALYARRLVALVTVLPIAACSAGGSLNVPTRAPQSAARTLSGSPIQHVVFIVQENRSFNNLFMDYPGAKTQNYGYDTEGHKIRLHPRGLESSWDIAHTSTAFFAACDGQGKLPGTDCKMDGWNKEVAEPNPPRNPAYSYVPQTETKPYWAMARDYVLADHMFASNLDGSFVAHQYIVAGYASQTVDFPVNQWGCQGGKDDTVRTLTQQRDSGPAIPACFDNPTIASEADAAGVSWRFYAGLTYGNGGLWSSYQADRKIYRGPDWAADVIDPPAQFLTDIGKGKLANVTWITPTWQTSDHPGLSATQGPAWVASVVDAVGKSSFWKSTAIFIIWDDWGGWFDPVKPVYKDYDGLGFRVPLLIVSPYAKEGYVTHAQYETASVLRFIEDNFGLSQLAKSDGRAADPVGDAFDYYQPPRKFKRIGGAKPSSYWMRLERADQLLPKPASILGDD